MGGLFLGDYSITHSESLSSDQKGPKG